MRARVRAWTELLARSGSTCQPAKGERVRGAFGHAQRRLVGLPVATLHVTADSADRVEGDRICSQPDADVPRCGCFEALRLIDMPVHPTAAPRASPSKIVDDVPRSGKRDRAASR